MLKELLAKGATLVTNPDFLIGSGMGFTLVAVVTAFYEGTQAQEDLHKKEEELERDLTKPEKVAVYAKRAIVPTVASVAGEAMIFVGTRKQSKTIQLLGASLQAATLYSNTQTEKVNKLESTMREMLGEKKSNDILDKSALERFKTNPPIDGSNIYDTGKGNKQVIFQFEPDGSYFWSSYEQIALDEAAFNKIFSTGSASDDDLRKSIGIPSGLINESLMYYKDFPEDYIEFKMRPDEGGWIDVNGVKHQYCLLRIDRNPIMA